MIYREQAPFVMEELDLRPGDVVVDIGAGDGWWANQMARYVGEKGTIHALEVDQQKVDAMKEKCADHPQVKPYLGPTDGTGLPENSVDLVFISKTYHHLDPEKHDAYLRHLRGVIRPTGRLCIVERRPDLAKGLMIEHAWSPGDLEQSAARAGWILVRYELIPKSYHYIAIFAQKELFPLDEAR